ncbi:uncharacterized protein KY384_000557 [Bacidia gigantensis]|uniref:uncharacterized protein n=1 Tax=Bacidia gigantensis TaxID=2732470 RepID=UPI001D040706|nr:uncharacterized protein KY384_000557 [Bacidia gigantensis]KAG8525797.1 hypothetical protein KY384_000557 [Bacidia gigantensis]
MARAPRYAGSDDEYLSEDEELSDSDLNMLNTDYNVQRDLTYYSPRGHLQQSSSPTYDLPTMPEKYEEDPEALDTTSIPIRDASLRYRDSMYCNDQLDYYLLPHRIPTRKSHAYPHQFPRPRRRPLIDYIKNEWQQSALNSSSPTSDHYDQPDWMQIFFAPRFQRSALVLVLCLFLLWGNWWTWAGPKISEQYGLRQSTKERMQYAEGWFGANLRPDFVGMKHVEQLDDELVPGIDGKAPGHRRLVVIGDVHGCAEELEALLGEARYSTNTDHLIFTGDLISKGPSSPAVVDIAIQHNASCVRGNHEDRVLLTHRDLSSHPTKIRGEKPPLPGVPADAALPNIVNDQLKLIDEVALDTSIEEFSRLDIRDRATASQLNKKQIQYLSSCPTILDIGQVPGLGDLHVVHAGLIPSVRLEQQDPISVMHMRTVDLETHVPSEDSKGTPWHKLWNKYQSLIPVEKRSTVVYGHDSKKGLQIKKWSKGIDTGCFKGGRLTAIIFDGHPTEEPRTVSVPCKDYRHLEKELLQSAREDVSV